MIELCKPEDCTGCMACGNACRHGAIEFVQNEEGFLHPKINVEKCVECKMCVRACPILTPCSPAGTQEEKQVFAAWAKDEEIRMESSSGGIFSVLAKDMLSRGGIVFGAAFDENFKLRHIGVEDEKSLEKLRGSKYVQSEIGDAFVRVERFLKSGRNVLFSGTPCQIAGLRMFLRKSYENLLTIDIVCHGVPSPLVFQSYKTWLEIQLGSPLVVYKFRDKRWSWKNYNTKASPLGGRRFQHESLFANNNKESNNAKDLSSDLSPSKGKLQHESPLRADKDGTLLGTWQEDPWMRGFLREYFLREGCHSCRFANVNRPADITLADYWGYHARKGAFRDDDRGISMVMINNNHGKKAFEKIKSDLVFIETPVDEAVRGNPALSRCFPPSSRREEFWADFRKEGYAGTLEKYMYPEPVGLVLRALYRNGRNSFQYFAVRALLFAFRFPRRCVRFVWKRFKAL